MKSGNAFSWLSLLLFLFLSCTDRTAPDVDRLNAQSYDSHYRNLDSTATYARQAFMLAKQRGYGDGQAEALNNLAFVDIATMHYDDARQHQ